MVSVSLCRWCVQAHPEWQEPKPLPYRLYLSLDEVALGDHPDVQFDAGSGDDAGRLDLVDRDVVDLGVRGFVARGERGDGEEESEELAHGVGSFQNLKAEGFSGGVGR
jgi:hypothetical protein